jgi:hypothetical protein
MSRLTKLLRLSRTRNNQLGEDAEIIQGAEEVVERIGTATEFLNEVAEKLETSDVQSLGDAIDMALPWLESAADVVGEALPPIKAVLKIIGYATKETDARGLGLLAFSLAYQSSTRGAVKAIEQERQSKSEDRHFLKTKSLGSVRLIDSESLEAFDGFKLKDYLSHPLMKSADAALDKLASAVGWPAEVRRTAFGRSA